MPRTEKVYTQLGYCTIDRATQKAVLLTAEDGAFAELWVPKSVIETDNEDLREGLVDDIAVETWWWDKNRPEESDK